MTPAIPAEHRHLPSFELLPGSGPGRGGGHTPFSLSLLWAIGAAPIRAVPLREHPELQPWCPQSSAGACHHLQPPPLQAHVVFLLFSLSPPPSFQSRLLLSPPSTVPSSPPNLSCFSFEPSPSFLWTPPTLFPLPSCYTEQHVTTGWVPAPAAWPCSRRVSPPRAHRRLWEEPASFSSQIPPWIWVASAAHPIGMPLLAPYPEV